MKIKLLSIIIIMILLAVGMSGCIGGTSIKDIIIHPNKYLDKEVTIKAYNSDSFLIYQTKFLSNEAESGIYIFIPDNISTPILVNGGEYYFIGIVRYNDKNIIHIGVDIYLEVSKIEPV